MPYTEFHYTPTGTGVISGKEVLEQTEDAINDLGGQISGDVQTAIDTANNALNTANSASADAQNAVNTANTAYTAATNAQNTANAAQNTASNALTAAQNAQNDVNALGNRVTTAENNISQNTTDITNLTTRMGTAEGNITTLQNDVVTAQGTATSAQNTATMARQQAYVFRYSGTAVVPNSTIAYSTIDNTDNIKSGDKILDVDGKLFEITAVDTTNQTVTVGSALIDLALDANVMHLSGNETAAGIKTFSDETYIKSLNFTNEVLSTSSTQSAILPIICTVTYTDQTASVTARLNLRITANGDKSLYPQENNAYSLGLSSRSWSDFYSYHGYFRGQQQNDEYSGNARTNLTLLANRDTVGASGCLIDTFRANVSQGTALHIMGFGIKENSLRYEGCRFSWEWDNNLNGYSFDFKPTKQGTYQAVKHNLGTSTEKWDTLNGINPGALSFPDLNNGVDISGYVTVVANANKESLYTPPANGWICVRLSRTNGASGVLLKQGDLAVSGKNIEVESGVTTSDATMPVVGGVQVSINSALADAVVSAKFYPCLGNV